MKHTKILPLLAAAILVTGFGPASTVRAAQSPATASQAPTAQKTEVEVQRITVDELKAKLAAKEPVFIIDSRSQGSYGNSEIKIKGAVRIPMDEVESRLAEIPRDKEIVIYCT